MACLNCGAELPPNIGFCGTGCAITYSRRPGIPSHLRARDEIATVLTDCLTCDAMIETLTGLEGVAQMERAGWEAVSGDGLGVPAVQQGTG